MAPEKKLFCKRGHLRSPDNLMGRSCKTCYRTLTGPNHERSESSKAVRRKYKLTKKRTIHTSLIKQDNISLEELYNE